MGAGVITWNGEPEPLANRAAFDYRSWRDARLVLEVCVGAFNPAALHLHAPIRAERHNRAADVTAKRSNGIRAEGVPMHRSEPWQIQPPPRHGK